MYFKLEVFLPWLGTRQFILENLNSDTQVFVKDLEKVKWVRKFLMNTLLVECVDDEISSIKKIRDLFSNVPRCKSHSKMCAVENCFLIKKILSNLI
jgi:hypothetical protein